MPSIESDELINQYFDVCSRALKENKDRFPFKQILGAARDSGRGQVVEVIVVDSEKGERHFVVQMHGDAITLSPHGSCGECQCDRSWVVGRPYLEEVSRHPEAYIRNPALIDWEWMYAVPAD